MAVWSEVSIVVVDASDRLDADYYDPQDLVWLRRARRLGGSPLGRICKVMNGRTPTQYSNDGDVGVVRSGDLVAPLLYPHAGAPFLRTQNLPGLVGIKAGDVLISSIGMGSIGKISLVMNGAGLVTVSEVTILRDPEYPPEYIAAYLRTNEGQRQILREVTGATGQQHLLKSKVKEILIPPPPKDIERLLVKLYAQAWDQEKQLASTYSEAEKLVIASLKSSAS